MADPSPDSSESVRIDRWLLAARLYKTRALAQEACAGGKVEINRSSASAHKPVRVGDRVHLSTPRGARDLIVRGLGERRLSPSEAVLLFEDVTPPAPARPELRDAPGAPWAIAAGRPSKRDRRQIARLRGR